jgi:hypothetical protein
MTQHCQRCGQISESASAMKFCPQCGAPYEEASEMTQIMPTPEPTDSAQAAPSLAEEQQVYYVPWEDKGNLGFLGALFETFKESCFNPGKFFEKMPVKGGIGNPLLYGLILGFIGMIFQVTYSQMFSQLFDFTKWLPAMPRSFDSDFIELNRKIQSYSNVVSLFAFPFIATAGFFIWSGIIHLLLTMFGWKKHDYESSFRIVTYSEGPAFFRLIPFIGDIVAPVWQLVITVIGISKVHKISIGKAILVVVLPALLFCACCCGMVIWIIGLVGITN